MLLFFSLSSVTGVQGPVLPVGALSGVKDVQHCPRAGWIHSERARSYQGSSLGGDVVIPSAVLLLGYAEFLGTVSLLFFLEEK